MLSIFKASSYRYERMDTQGTPPFSYQNKNFFYVHMFLLFMIGPLSVVSPRAIIWPFALLSLAPLFFSISSYLMAPQAFMLNYFSYQRSSNLSPPLLKILAFFTIIIHMIFAKMPHTGALLGVFGLFFLCRRLLSSLDSIDKQRSLQAFFFGILAALVLLSLDHMSGNGWQHIRKISSAKAFAHTTQILALSFWPVFLFALKHYKEKVNPILVISSLVGLFVYPLWFIDCDAGIYSLLFGLIGAGITYALPRFVERWIGPLFLGVVLASPFIALYFFTPENILFLNQYIKNSSALDRLYIWHEVATLWLNHPFIGYGFDSAHELSNTLGTHTWSHMDAKGILRMHTTLRLPMHPHNVFLQLFMETGILGVSLFLLGMQNLFSRVTRWFFEKDIETEENERLYRACIIGLFCTALFIANVSVGAWQTWWLSALFLSSALLVLGCKR